jgi:ribonuclease BN (tRNA processing enzyme)
MEIRTESNDLIIVDAGTGIRRLGNLLTEEGRRRFNFIFTHAHWDHLMGFPFFKPLYKAHTEIRMHRCPFSSKYVENMLTKVMDPPNFPVRYADLKARITYEEGCPTKFTIGSATVIPIALSHPNKGNGYKFVENGKTFVFLTDNELGYIHEGGLNYEAYREFCRGADLLIHDAEYTPEEYETTIEWGHSVYTDVLRLAFEAGVKSLGLFHLNQDRTDDQMDEIVVRCRDIVEKEGRPLQCFAVASGMTFSF